MNTSKKRFTLIAMTVAAVLLGGGIAAAYWTTTGSGTGSAGVGTDAGVTVVHDNTVSGLVPAGAAQPIDFTVTNSSATAPVQISNVVIGFGSFATGCSAAHFVLTQPSRPSVATPLAIPGAGSLSFTSGGAGPSRATGATIAMLNTGSNQNACKLSTVNLTFSVS